jgi:putative ABC transport system permease protein
VIGLVLAAVRARPAQALTVVLLAAFVTASAVAVPAYLAVADRSVIANEWAAASVAERTVRAASTVELRDQRDRTFETDVPARLSGSGFTTVFAAETDVHLTGGTAVANPRFVFRQDVCAHLVLTSGRCPVGSDEVMLGEAMARLFGLRVGQLVPVQHAKPVPSEGLQPDPGEPSMTVSVVGVFRVPQPHDAYWALQDYFVPDPDNRNAAEPIFTSRGTLEALGHPQERQYVDGILSRADVRADRLAALRGWVAAANRDSAQTGATTVTGVPALLDRIDRDRRTLREVVPLAAVPLLGLGWFLLYFAVSYTADRRRGEIGLVRLRGTGRIRRWVLALGDGVLAVLAGTALAFLIGVAAGATWRYGLLALLGGLLAVALAGRRTFAGPVVELLRQVPPRSARWRAATAEGVLLVLAAAAVVQLRTSTGRLTGLTLLAPGLVLLAVALLAARLVVPVTAVLGRRALHRGRLGRGLGALQLARRPGTARLVTVLVVALAELLYATGAADVASRARSERVTVALGAPRLLRVAPVPAARLLAAVRQADPEGRYAMAVSTIPSASGGDPPMLAVDAPRLARVATWWPEFGPLSAEQVAARLHPAAPVPVLIHSQEIALDLTVAKVDPTARLHLFAAIVTLDDSFSQLADFGELHAGRHAYQASMTRCVYGCRLTGLQLASPADATVTVALVLHRLTEGQVAIPVDAGFRDTGRWRTPEVSGDDPVPHLTPGPDGLAVHLSGPATISNGRFVPVDTAYPLPVVSTAPLPRDHLGQIGSDSFPVVRVGGAGMLPGLGRSGVLVDLEYADRIASSTADASGAAVWLAGGAPADIEHRLTAAGLTITGSRTLASEVGYLSRQGPGAGLRFHLIAGVLAMLLAVGGLALVATVDRRGPRPTRRGRRRGTSRGDRAAAAVGEFGALRAQGLPDRTIARANLFAYTVLVAAALGLAPLAAGAAWWATGAKVPVFADGQSPVPPPAWPGATAVLWPWLLAGGLMLIAAVAIAYRNGAEGKRS